MPTIFEVGFGSLDSTSTAVISYTSSTRVLEKIMQFLHKHSTSASVSVCSESIVVSPENLRFANVLNKQ
jgi:hypothetical protein